MLCKRVKNDGGYWENLEKYIQDPPGTVPGNKMNLAKGAVNKQSAEDLIAFQRLVRRVPVADPVLRYALALVRNGGITDIKTVAGLLWLQAGLPGL